MRPARGSGSWHRRLLFSGRVNYVRDDASVARENARRRWWMFRAIRGFRIEDETTTGIKGKYDWEGVARQIRQRARLEGL